MAFYDWLEGVSNAIDEKIDIAEYMVNEYGFLTALGCSLPTERSDRLNSILLGLEWMSFDNEFDTEQDIANELDDMAIALYTERYNEIKYWWMPSK